MVAVFSVNCIRNKHLGSTCRACADACEKQAITISDNSLSLNPLLCNRCGNCVLSCPVNAVEGELPVRRVEEGRLYSSASSIASVDELLLYFASGVTRLAISQQHQRWIENVEIANSRLQQMGKSGFDVEITQDNEDAISYSRRSLLGFRQLQKHFDKSSINKKPLADAYSGFQFYQFTLNEDNCTLCGSCARLCPTHALTLSDNALTFEGKQCVGCRLCQDLCPEQAISIKDEIASSAAQSHKMIVQHCSQCDAEYQTLNTQREICPSCRFRERLNIPHHSIGQLSLRTHSEVTK